MKVIRNEATIYFDVDDTLIMWKGAEHEKKIYFKDPYLGTVFKVWPNESNINLLKEKATRGFTVIVWSAGGYRHAEAIVKTLGLASYVDFVMSKPTAYVDDKPVEHWFPKRIYLEAAMRYKCE